MSQQKWRTMELKPHEYQKYYPQKGGFSFSLTGKTRLGPKIPSLSSFINKGIKAGNSSKARNLFTSLQNLSQARKQLTGKGHCQTGKGRKRTTNAKNPFQLDPKRRRGRQSN